MFLTQSSLLGIQELIAHYLYVSGFDLSGKLIDIATYRERAVAMSAIRSAWLDIHVSCNHLLNLGLLEVYSIRALLI